MEESTGSRRAVVAVLLLPACLGVVLSLVLTSRAGVGVTPDSVTYLAAARSLAAGEGYRQPDGDPYVQFPPLLPTLIAALSVGGGDPVDAARWVTALAFGVTIAATGWAVARLTGSVLLAGFGAGVVLLSRPVLSTALHVWSEPPFMALTMLCLAANLVRLARPSGGAGGAAVLLASLGALMRYIGVTLVVTSLIVALIERPSRPGARLRRAAIAALGLAPLVVWCLRNLAVSSTVAGERYPSAESLSGSTAASVEALLRWSLPLDLPLRARALLAGCIAALLVALTVVALRTLPNRAPAERLRRCAPFAVFCALYLVYLLAASALTALDPIDERLIAPLIPPAVVVALTLLDMARRLAPARLMPAGTLAGSVAVVAWLVALSVPSVRYVRGIEANGIDGYESRVWHNSETLRLLAAQPPAGVIYSNDPFAIAHRTEREARLSPRRHPYQSPRTAVDDLPRLLAAVDTSPEVYLVWFDRVPRDFLLSLDELAAILDLQPVARTGDGVMYRITARR